MRQGSTLTCLRPSWAHGSTSSETETIDDWNNDTRNPCNWSEERKWFVTSIACFATFLVGLNSTAITTGSKELSAEFNIRDGLFEYTFLTVTAWNVSAAVVPLVTLPLLETYGMKAGYRIFYPLFTLFILPQALARNYATLVASRVVAGAAGGWILNAVDGIIANMWTTSLKRSLPVLMYSIALVLGVTLGPVQGAVVKPLGWRWIFWIELIIYGTSLPVILVGIPETRGDIIRTGLLSRHLHRIETSSIQSEAGKGTVLEAEPRERNLARDIWTSTSRAFTLLFTEPVLFCFTLWSAFSFGLVFILTQSVAQVFPRTYAWEAFSTGLVQSSLAIGELLGAGACIVANKWYLQSKDQNTETPGMPVPESVLYLPIPATFIGLAGGLFMYGWSSFQSEHAPPWVVPAVGLGIVGFAIQTIVWAASVYITDAYSTYAASAIAGIALGENIFAAVLPLAAKPMYTRLGFQWASSLLGFVALALGVAPLLLLWKGPWIRSKSPAITRV